MVVWGGLTNSQEKKRSERQRRKGKLYPFECRVQRVARRDKKAFLSDQWKEIEENNRMRKTRATELNWQSLRFGGRGKTLAPPYNWVLFSHSVVSHSLWPHRLQHTRLPYPSPSSGACLNISPPNRWFHPTISSSVILLLLPQSFPASGSFLMSWLFASGGQSIGASASVVPMNIQDWSPLGWTGLISLQSEEN